MFLFFAIPYKIKYTLLIPAFVGFHELTPGTIYFSNLISHYFPIQTLHVSTN